MGGLIGECRLVLFKGAYVNRVTKGTFAASLLVAVSLVSTAASASTLLPSSGVQINSQFASGPIYSPGVYDVYGGTATAIFSPGPYIQSYVNSASPTANHGGQTETYMEYYFSVDGPANTMVELSMQYYRNCSPPLGG